MIAVECGAATDVGAVREHNEDAFHAGRRGWAVADGMGGHAAGEVASGLAIAAMAALDAAEHPLTEESLVAAVRLANAAILRHGRRRRSARGLGTTLTGVALVDAEGGPALCVFNVGDSRVYGLTGGRLVQVTVDHSEVEELVARGVLTPEEARVHPLRNLVTRCLGMPDDPEVDTWLVRPVEGDRLLIASDGLHGEVPDAEIEALLGAGEPAEATARALVAAALAAGGHDNATVLVLDVTADA